MFWFFLLFPLLLTAEIETLAAELRGVLVTSKAQKGDSVSEGVQFQEVFVPDEEKLKEILCPYLGRPLTLPLIEEMKEKIYAYYRNEGYSVVSVRIPAEKNVRKGTLVAIVLVGKVGQIRVEGARWFSDEWIRDQIRAQPGEYVDLGSLRDDVAWISRNPFLDATLVLEKGVHRGETNINIDAQDQFPLRVYGSYETTGNLIAGDSRYRTGARYGNLWGVGHIGEFEFQTAPDLSEWWSATVSYKAPLPWHHLFEMFGGYVRTKPNIASLEDLIGYKWQTSGRYRVPFRSSEHYQHELVVGYDFKRTNNFLTIDPTQITPTSIDVSQFALGYQGHETDRWGRTAFDVTLVASPGYMTAFDDKQAYSIERPGAVPTYAYLKSNVERYTSLPAGFGWLTNAAIQLTKEHLIPSEEFSLGGFETVRGYDESEIVSDRGFLLRNEVRTPPLRFSKRHRAETELLALGFIDFGYANDVDQDIFDRNSVVLASVGVGGRFHVGDYLIAFLDWGYQLHQLKNRPFASTTPHRLHAGVEVGF